MAKTPVKSAASPVAEQPTETKEPIVAEAVPASEIAPAIEAETKLADDNAALAAAETDGMVQKEAPEVVAEEEAVYEEIQHKFFKVVSTLEAAVKYVETEIKIGETFILEEEAELIKANPVFKIHKANGFVTISEVE